MSLCSSKNPALEARSAQLQKDIEEFKANGGKVERLPGVGEFRAGNAPSDRLARSVQLPEAPFDPDA